MCYLVFITFASLSTLRPFAAPRRLLRLLWLLSPAQPIWFPPLASQMYANNLRTTNTVRDEFWIKYKQYVEAQAQLAAVKKLSKKADTSSALPCEMKALHEGEESTALSVLGSRRQPAKRSRAS